MNKRVILLETALILGVLMFLTLLGSISSDAPVYGEAHVGSRDIDPLRVHDSSGAPANGEALTVTKTVHDSSGAPANGGGQSASSVDAGSFGVQIVVFVE